MVQTVELELAFPLTALLVTLRPEGELIRDLLLLTLPQVNWRPIEDVNSYALRTASLRQRTIEKGFGDKFQKALTRLSYLSFWVDPPRLNSVTRKFKWLNLIIWAFALTGRLHLSFYQKSHSDR